MVKTIQMNRFQRRMKPVCRLIKVISSTGAGKTELTKFFASKMAAMLIEKCIGKTNSTITPRTLVYTNEYDNKIIVATKPSKLMINKIWFDSRVSEVLAEYIYSCKGIYQLDKIERVNTLKKIIRNNFKPNSNINASITLIPKDKRNIVFQELINIIDSKILTKELTWEYYSEAKRAEKKEESNQTPRKLKIKIISIVNSLFDVNSELVREIYSTFTKLNDSLKDVYHHYFNEESISIDGYYCKEIHEDDIANKNDFIEHFFTNNNNDNHISIETLCDDIVIYVPIDEGIAKYLRSVYNLNNIFTNAKGHISFAIKDHMGLFHKNTTEKDNEDYFDKMAYSEHCDAIILMAPIEGDSNHKKLISTFKKFLVNYPYSTPILIVNNKVDLYIDEEIKNKDPRSEVGFGFGFSIEKNSSVNFTDDVILELEKILNNLSIELMSSQSKKRHPGQIDSVATFFKLPLAEVSREKIEKYLPEIMIKSLFKLISNNVEYTKEKIPFCIDSNDELDIRFVGIENLLTPIFESNLWMNKIYNPVIKNINENIMIVPHGQGYNKLDRKTPYGGSCYSHIDDEWFQNCSSFDITFPGNLKNLISKELIKPIILEKLVIENGTIENELDFKQKVLENLLDLSNNYLNANLKREMFIGKLLYDTPFMDAKLEGMTFGSKFQGYLRNVQDLVKEPKKNVGLYVDAIQETLKPVLLKIIDEMIIYTQSDN